MNTFLVEIEIATPSTLPPAERSALADAEMRRGKELLDEGTIEHIWRIPGRRANLGIWRAEDPTALHALLESLPLFPYMDVRVTPLATHPLRQFSSA